MNLAEVGTSIFYCLKDILCLASRKLDGEIQP
jgi:hypothetical protein